MAKKPKRPRDTNQLAKSIVDLATGDADDTLRGNKAPKTIGKHAPYNRKDGANKKKPK